MFAGEGAAEISALRERLSAAVAGLDLGTCLPSTVAALVEQGEQIERLGRAIKTLAAARVADTHVWRAGGARSPEEWLARQTGTSKTDAAAVIQTGQRLEDLPATAAAVKQGRLSRAQAEAVAGAATADPTAEGRLLERAATGSLGELRNEAARTRAAADPDPDATRRRAHERRSCRHWVDAEGLGHLHATGPADTIARLGARLTHRAGAVFEEARREDRREPLEAYAFDALVESVTSDGDGRPLPAGADAKIIVRVDHGALVRGHVRQGEVCEIAGEGPIPVAVAREWMDDAFVAAVLTEGTDVTKVVHLGRRFTATQRTALQWRQPECCIKGCTNTLRLEYDHHTGWAITHTTSTDDANRLCPYHHQCKTLGWHLGPPDEHGKREIRPPSDAAQEGARQLALTGTEPA